MSERDRRGWVIAVAYFALVEPIRLLETAGASPHVRVGSLHESHRKAGTGMTVAVDGRRYNSPFHHQRILAAMFVGLRAELATSTVAFDGASRCRLRELRQVIEGLLDSPVDKDSFRRRVHSRSLVRCSGEFQQGVSHRPAELFERAR